MSELKTRFGFSRYFPEKRLVHHHIIEKELNVYDLRDLRKAARQFTNGKPYVALITFKDEFLTPSSGRIEKGDENNNVGTAVVIKSLNQRLIINSIGLIHNLKGDLKIFEDEASALKWLEERILESENK